MSGVRLSLLVLGIFGLFHSSLGDYCASADWGNKSYYPTKTANVTLPAGQQNVPLWIPSGNDVCGANNFAGETVVACDIDQAPIIDPIVDPTRAYIHRKGLFDGYCYVIYYCKYPVLLEAAVSGPQVSL